MVSGELEPVYDGGVGSSKIARPLRGQDTYGTPLKINMEPKNHPCAKEHHLPFPSYLLVEIGRVFGRELI